MVKEVPKVAPSGHPFAFDKKPAPDGELSSSELFADKQKEAPNGIRTGAVALCKAQRHMLQGVWTQHQPSAPSAQGPSL